MIKTREKKIYFYIFAATLVISCLIGSVSIFSRMVIEVKADKLLTDAIALADRADMSSISTADLKIINEKYKEAYILIRKPQLFAAYKNFDDQSRAIKKILQQYDQVASGNGAFEPDSFIYINYLLNRRKSGSYLGIYTALVFLAMAAVSGATLLLTKSEN
ncbi:MAG: hypothetical protein JW982_02840 [Spirochaetes bacterium]|nr:hypothetical protein [Spirochaetota bacterium]